MSRYGWSRRETGFGETVLARLVTPWPDLRGLPALSYPLFVTTTYKLQLCASGVVLCLSIQVAGKDKTVGGKPNPSG